MNKGYEVTLRWVMKHHVTTMAASVVVLRRNHLYVRISAQRLYPERRYGQVLINTEGAQGVSYEQMVQYQQQLAAIVAKDPNVESFFSSIGAGRHRADGEYRPYIYETQAAKRTIPEC